MFVGWRRIGRDLKQRRFVDAYTVAFVAFILAGLSLVTDIVPDQVRCRLRNAREVWVFAPSGVNLLSAHNCEILRIGPLSRAGGVVKVVVLDPAQAVAVQLATRQLDDSLDYPVQDFTESLQTIMGLLRAMAAWQVNGSFEYRLLDYNPGFSLVAIDPSSRSGRIIVEFHGFHNEATSSRMHIEISRGQSDHWYSYWIDQFDRIWEATSLPTDRAVERVHDDTRNQDLHT